MRLLGSLLLMFVAFIAFAALTAWEWIVTTQTAWRLGYHWKWLRRKTLDVLDEYPERFTKKIAQTGPYGRATFRRRRR